MSALKFRLIVISFLDIDSISHYNSVSKSFQFHVNAAVSLNPKIKNRISAALTESASKNFVLPPDHRTIFQILFLQKKTGCQRCHKPRISKIWFPFLIRLCSDCIDPLLCRDYQLKKDLGETLFNEIFAGHSLSYIARNGLSITGGYRCYLKRDVNERLRKLGFYSYEAAKKGKRTNKSNNNNKGNNLNINNNVTDQNPNKKIKRW
jgi:hypothetical protein